MDIKLKPFLYELEQSFAMRKLFIEKYGPTNEKELTEAKRLAHIWVNFKFLGCIYPIPIMDQIQRVLDGNGQAQAQTQGQAPARKKVIRVRRTAPMKNA